MELLLGIELFHRSYVIRMNYNCAIILTLLNSRAVIIINVHRISLSKFIPHLEFVCTFEKNSENFRFPIRLLLNVLKWFITFRCLRQPK